MNAANDDDARPRPPSPSPCPICGKPAVPGTRPFCSKRCADVDLHRWLGGRYVVKGEEDEHATAGEAREDD